uniref:Putative ovule protein n=1 Tax=Solanum chacoense TaxID=4108 RepID=A0A0V0HVD8_SOLCH
MGNFNRLLHCFNSSRIIISILHQLFLKFLMFLFNSFQLIQGLFSCIRFFTSLFQGLALFNKFSVPLIIVLEISLKLSIDSSQLVPSTTRQTPKVYRSPYLALNTRSSSNQRLE